MVSEAIEKFDKWHKTLKGYAIMGFLELLVAYIIASRAIDTGSWWEYLFTLVFLVGGAQNALHLIRLRARKGHGKN